MKLQQITAMKKIFNTYRFYLVLLILTNYTLLAISAQAKGVEFTDGNWSEVVGEARNANKFIFVKAYADWCLPCIEMLANEFSESEVGQFYNANFVNVKLNIESPEGKLFKEKYNIKGVPDLFFFDANGKLLHHETGLKGKTELLDIAKEILVSKPTLPAETTAKELPSPQPIGEGGNVLAVSLPSMQRQYDAGFRHASFLYEFAYILKKQELPYYEVANDYLDKIRKNTQSPRNLQFVYDFADDLRTGAMDLLIKNKSLYERRIGTERLNLKIKQAVMRAVKLAKEREDTKLYEEARAIAQKADFPQLKAFLFEMDKSYFQGVNNWESYAETICEYMKAYRGKDAQFLYMQAQAIIETSNDNKQLGAAKEWVEQSIFIEPQYQSYETYTRILFHLGLTKEAEKAAQKAIELGKLNGTDFSRTLRLLDRIQGKPVQNSSSNSLLKT